MQFSDLHTCTCGVVFREYSSVTAAEVTNHMHLHSCTSTMWLCLHLFLNLFISNSNSSNVPTRKPMANNFVFPVNIGNLAMLLCHCFALLSLLTHGFDQIPREPKVTLLETKVLGFRNTLTTKPEVT